MSQKLMRPAAGIQNLDRNNRPFFMASEKGVQHWVDFGPTFANWESGPTVLEGVQRRHPLHCLARFIRKFIVPQFFQHFANFQHFATCGSSRRATQTQVQIDPFFLAGGAIHDFYLRRIGFAFHFGLGASRGEALPTTTN
jgi:hypothetical protein